MRPCIILDGPGIIYLIGSPGHPNPAIRVLRVNITAWQAQACDRQRQLRWAFGDLERVPAEINL